MADKENEDNDPGNPLYEPRRALQQILDDKDATDEDKKRARKALDQLAQARAKGYQPKLTAEERALLKKSEGSLPQSKGATRQGGALVMPVSITQADAVARVKELDAELEAIEREQGR